MPVPGGGGGPLAPLVGPLVYDPVLSRVRLSATGLFDGVPVRVERSTNQVVWTTVRGGLVVPAGGEIRVDDYEFAADVLNYYRVIGPSVWDTYTRSVSNGWGSTDTGDAYTVSGGVAAEYSVDGTKGIMSHTSVDVMRHAYVDIGVTDATLTADFTSPVLPTGAGVTHRFHGRANNTSNYYEVQLLIATSGAVTIRLWKRVAGVLNFLSAGVAVGTHAAGNTWRIMFDFHGSTLSTTAWKPASEAEPSAWQQTATDTALTTGTLAGVAGRLESGNTNTLPVAIQHDDLVVTDPQGVVWTGSITPVLDRVWLKSLARPFLNRKVTVVDYSDVERASRSGVFPIVGRSFPVAVTDLHGSRQWTLDVLANTAQEAEELDLLVSTGEVQFVHVPAAERVPGGYVALGNTTERRPGRRSIRRVFSMPFTECAAPGADVIPAVGTWQSVINSYATWADVLAAHPTWESLLQLVGSPADVIVP